MTLDLALMIDSDMFIGGFSTNVARVVYEVMTARRGCYVPFATVDVPWCQNNGQPMGKEHLNENNSKWAGASC